MLITSLGQRIVVRYARKPIWMATAPSKLFRISENIFYDQEEIRQIRELFHAHQAQMASIKSYMEREFYIPATQSGGIPAEFLEQESKEDEEIYAENDRINAEIAKQKEEYFANKIEELENQVMEEKLSREEHLIETAEKIDEYIKKTKSDPDNFVTPDNFDELLDKALESPQSYEFCIDRSGRIYGSTQNTSTGREKVDTRVPTPNQT